MTTDPTVFVVDDDAAIRDSLTLLLEGHGFMVECFESGQDFLDRIGPDRRGCALIDVQMPGMGGLDVQQRLSQTMIALPVVIITGHAEVPIAVKAMKAGALDFIEKPFEADVLLAAIRRGFAAAAARRPIAVERQAARAKIDRLTSREQEVFHRLAAGKPNKIIAFELGISPRTVEVHRARVMEKLDARSLSEIVRLALAAA
ncbi:MAG: response regulator transcription factor [Dongiaceae bacterium]